MNILEALKTCSVKNLDCEEMETGLPEVLYDGTNYELMLKNFKYLAEYSLEKCESVELSDEVLNSLADGDDEGESFYEEGIVSSLVGAAWVTKKGISLPDLESDDDVWDDLYEDVYNYEINLNGKIFETERDIDLT